MSASHHHSDRVAAYICPSSMVFTAHVTVSVHAAVARQARGQSPGTHGAALPFRECAAVPFARLRDLLTRLQSPGLQPPRHGARVPDSYVTCGGFGGGGGGAPVSNPSAGVPGRPAAPAAAAAA